MEVIRIMQCHKKKTLIISAIVVAILGTLFHFTYEWSGENFVVGLFTPVNESIWEHMKLIFFPTLLVGIIISYPLEKCYPNIILAILAGLLCGTLLIPTLFYTYSGVLGFSLAAIDITIFYVCVIVTFFIICKWASNDKLVHWKYLLYLLTLLFVLAFIRFSYHPPMLGIFTIPTR